MALLGGFPNLGLCSWLTSFDRCVLRILSARPPSGAAGLLGQLKFAFLKAEVVSKAAESGCSAGSVFFPQLSAVWWWNCPCSIYVPVPFPCSHSLADCVVISFTKSSINLTGFFSPKEFKLKVVLGLKQSIWRQKLIVPANSTWLLRQRFWICDGLFRS